MASPTQSSTNVLTHNPTTAGACPRILRRACLFVFSTKNSVPYRTPDYCGHVHAHVLQAQSISKNSGCAGGWEAPRLELAGASPNGPLRSARETVDKARSDCRPTRATVALFDASLPLTVTRSRAFSLSPSLGLT